MHYTLLILLFISLLSANFTEQNSANIIFTENFERYRFAEEGKSAPYFSLQKSGQSITSEIKACEGSSVVRFHVNSNLPEFEERRRSMLMMLPHPDNHGVLGEFGTFDTTVGEDFWYGFAIYVPNEWHTSALVWQEKAGLNYASYDGDTGVRTDMNPPIALYIDDKDNQLRWKYLIKSDPKMIAGPNSAVLGHQEYMGVVKKGAWNTFVIHATYTYKDNGQIEFWVNGNRYDYSGRTVVAPEGFRDAARRAANIPFDYADPHNFSFGIYKPELGEEPTGEQYTLYFDAFRVGNKNSSYGDVVPQCGLTWQNYIFLPFIAR